jgi:hypothetical protein
MDVSGAYQNIGGAVSPIRLHDVSDGISDPDCLD